MKRPTQLPIACSLGADELADRLAQIRALGKDALLGAGPEGSLRFRAGDGVRERLEAIIAAEAECCPFLDFELADDGGELVLSVTAPEGAEPVARELVAQFAR